MRSRGAQHRQQPRLHREKLDPLVVNLLATLAQQRQQRGVRMQQLLLQLSQAVFQFFASAVQH
jgi:urease gamma subunit